MRAHKDKLSRASEKFRERTATIHAQPHSAIRNQRRCATRILSPVELTCNATFIVQQRRRRTCIYKYTQCRIFQWLLKWTIVSTRWQHHRTRVRVKLGRAKKKVIYRIRARTRQRAYDTVVAIKKILISLWATSARANLYINSTRYLLFWNIESFIADELNGFWAVGSDGRVCVRLLRSVEA